MAFVGGARRRCRCVDAQRRCRIPRARFRRDGYERRRGDVQARAQVAAAGGRERPNENGGGGGGGGSPRVASILMSQLSAPMPQYVPPPEPLTSVDTDVSFWDRVRIRRLSFLQSVDPRVKLMYAASIALLPGLVSSSGIALSPLAAAQLCLCSCVGAFSVLCLPLSAAAPVLRRSLVFALLALLGGALAADSIAPPTQPRGLPPELDPLAGSLPQTSEPYRFEVFALGPLQVTRRGLRLAASSGALGFCVLQASSVLVLNTTRPEAVAAAVAWFLAPGTWLLQRIGFGASAARGSKLLVLTFLFALRFIDVVFSLARDVALGVATRGVRWRQLGFARMLNTLAGLLARFFSALFDTATSISEAMVARGFSVSSSSSSSIDAPGGGVTMMEDFALTRIQFRPIDIAMLFILIFIITGVIAMRSLSL